MGLSERLLSTRGLLALSQLCLKLLVIQPNSERLLKTQQLLVKQLRCVPLCSKAALGLQSSIFFLFTYSFFVLVSLTLKFRARASVYATTDVHFNLGVLQLVVFSSTKLRTFFLPIVTCSVKQNTVYFGFHFQSNILVRSMKRSTDYVAGRQLRSSRGWLRHLLSLQDSCLDSTVTRRRSGKESKNEMKDRGGERRRRKGKVYVPSVCPPWGLYLEQTYSSTHS